MTKCSTRERAVADKTIQLQERDFLVLLGLAFYGALDTVAIHLAYFAGVSDRVCRRRLSFLVLAGLVRRLTVGEYFGPAGRQPYVYTLTEKGAQLLRDLRDIENPRVLSDISPQFVAHTRDVANFALRFNASAKDSEIATPQWRFEYDLTDEFRVNPNPSTPYQKRYILHETFQPLNGNKNAKPFSYRPDAAFLLSHKQRFLCAYIERDNSTEPHRVLMRKLRGVARLISEKRYQNHWELPTDAKVRVRVYFVTRTMRRLRSLLTALKTASSAAELRFVAESQLDKNLLTDAVWYSTTKPDKPGALLNV